MAPPSTSTNLAFSTTCPTETKDKISAGATSAPFNKKIQQKDSKKLINSKCGRENSLV
jgi:hypothetical protein